MSVEAEPARHLLMNWSNAVWGVSRSAIKTLSKKRVWRPVQWGTILHHPDTFLYLQHTRSPCALPGMVRYRGRPWEWVDCSGRQLRVNSAPVAGGVQAALACPLPGTGPFRPSRARAPGPSQARASLWGPAHLSAPSRACAGAWVCALLPCEHARCSRGEVPCHSWATCTPRRSP